MSEITEFRKEINKLKERNRKVDTSKAWETSFTRRSVLFVLTYLIAGFTLKMLENANPWKNALIPSIGFLLSTLTIPTAQNFWKKYIYK